MQKHPLVNRTSPKGQDFLGTCASCGKTGITARGLMEDECTNPKGMTQEEAVLEAIESKPHRGSIRNWHKVPSGKSYYIWGEFIDHPGFGNVITNSSPVFSHDVETGEIETQNSRYILIGPEQDFTKRQVRLWMEGTKTGEHGPAVRHYTVAEGRRQYEAILAEYKSLYAALELDRRGCGLSPEDQVALFGVAADRVWGS